MPAGEEMVDHRPLVAAKGPMAEVVTKRVERSHAAIFRPPARDDFAPPRPGRFEEAAHHLRVGLDQGGGMGGLRLAAAVPVIVAVAVTTARPLPVPARSSGIGGSP